MPIYVSKCPGCGMEREEIQSATSAPSPMCEGQAVHDAHEPTTMARIPAAASFGFISPDVDGKPAKALMSVNYAAIPVRPAGAAWSSVRDMLKYVSMELAEGRLPDGKTYIAKQPLLERRAPQVS